jgi:hypothetical protein
MVGNGWVRAPLKRGSYSLCGAPFLPPSNTHPLYWSHFLRYGTLSSGQVGQTGCGEGWWDLSDGPSRGMVEMLAAQPLGPLGSRHNLSKSLAPAADLLHHSLEPMESRDAKTSLRAIFAMIIYQIILDAGALPRIRDVACRAGISAKFFL